MKTIVKIVIFKDALKYSYRIDRSLACLKERERKKEWANSRFHRRKEEWTSLDHNWTYLRKRERERENTIRISQSSWVDKSKRASSFSLLQRSIVGHCVILHSEKEDLVMIMTHARVCVCRRRKTYQSTCRLICVWFFYFFLERKWFPALPSSLILCSMNFSFSQQAIRVMNMTMEFVCFFCLIYSHAQWY